MVYYKHNAIYLLYSSVKKIEHNKVTNVFKAFTLDGNEVSIDMSAVNTKATELETADAEKATAKATAQASGNTKLLALGLSQEEATALTGFTPSED